MRSRGLAMRPDMGRPWHELAVAVIDTETTGLPDAGGRCCEVAVVRFEGGVPVARFSSLIDPGCDIPQAATAIHNITTGMVRGAPRLEDVAGDLLRVCAGAVPAAYQAMFDRHMIHASITGTDCLAFDPKESWLDVMIICKHFDRYVSGAGRHKLVNACKRHGIVIEGAHRAEADAIGTGALLWAFKSKLGDVSAAELIRRCDVRRAEQEEEFQAWKARQKETA
jgi:DNA polymerase-3 subunit epsilon